MNFDVIRKLRAKIYKALVPWGEHDKPDDMTGAGHMMHYDEPRGIYDNALYDMPLSIPTDTWRGLSGDVQRAILSEATDRQTMWQQFDTPQRTGADLPFMPPVDDPLREWSRATRRYVLENTHSVFQRNPIANAAVKYTMSFVVGEGMQITYKNEMVEEVLQDFIDSSDNPVNELERQLVQDIQTDGEIFIRFFNEGGTTVIVPQRPWEVEYIETQAGFFRRPVSYEMQYTIQKGDYELGETSKRESVPARDMLHTAVNRHAYELRGRPDLYVVLPWLRAYKEWLQDRTRQNYWRGALLWWVQVTASNPAQLAAITARWSKPPAPGSIYVGTDKERIEAVQPSLGAQDASQDGRQIKLMSAIGLRMPEYMLADGENANLASTSSQEMPALTKFSDYQRIMITQVWEPIFERVIQNAIDAGLLPEEVEVLNKLGEPVTDMDGSVEMVPTIEAFDISYAPIKQEDDKTLVDALMISSNQGWLSDKTATEKLGLDYDEEQRNMQAEREQQRDAMARGDMPTPPGMNPFGGDPDNMPGEEQEDDDMPEQEGAE